jgi:hypothetical protein
LKAAADAWLSAPVAEQPARLAALEGIRWLEWGVRSYQRSVQGLTLALLAAQIVLTVRIPRPIGSAMALAGITYIVQGVVVGAEGVSANGTIPGLLAFVLDLAWMISLVVLAWQKPSRAAGGEQRTFWVLAVISTLLEPGLQGVALTLGSCGPSPRCCLSHTIRPRSPITPAR